MKAEIISIGDEILYGQTLDTNSHWISQELDALGIIVDRKVTIGDQRATILEAFAAAHSRADLVLITGGLGPTNDDLTKPCLVEYFKTQLIRNHDVLTHIQQLFLKAGREMSILNEQQADLPANCEVVKN
ncbi:MAG: competence/damage-inducible protein A, partial [Bacteroidota bacterium]